MLKIAQVSVFLEFQLHQKKSKSLKESSKDALLLFLSLFWWRICLICKLSNRRDQEPISFSKCIIVYFGCDTDRLSLFTRIFGCKSTSSQSVFGTTPNLRKSRVVLPLESVTCLSIEGRMQSWVTLQ